jgi:Recombination enhancement, RecA-dependent nuclease
MNKDELRFHNAIRAHGCIVCRQAGYESPAEIHHILSGGRRMGHYHAIGLCAVHHRGQVNNAEAVSRHPWRTEFERRYGTELELLEQTRTICGEHQR